AAVTSCALETNLDPVVLASSPVVEQHGRLLVVHHQDIHVPVVVIIRKRRAASPMLFAEHRAADRAHIEEASLGALLPEQVVFHGQQAPCVRWIFERASIHCKQNEPTVIVVIEEGSSPPDVAKRQAAESSLHVGDILKMKRPG